MVSGSKAKESGKAEADTDAGAAWAALLEINSRMAAAVANRFRTSRSRARTMAVSNAAGISGRTARACAGA